ncbi:MAG: hypothetical protein ABIA66_01445 [Candidatus Omnitrophota bacterium]
MDITERELRQAYMRTFNTADGQIVLKDLENRCFKRDATFMPMINMFREEIFMNEGKRQALLHIENMMSPEGINKLDASSGEGSE